MQLRAGLANGAQTHLIDHEAFSPDSTAEIQNAIKLATHFVVLITRAARHAPTVRIPALMARLAYDASAICFIPVNIDGTQAMEVTRDLFCLHWRSGASPHELLTAVTRRITHSSPTKRLATSSSDAEKAVGRAELAEENFRENRDVATLHEALRLFEEAISLDFCADKAWAGLARCLWKLREDNHAWKTVDIAVEIVPGSEAIRNAIALMHGGRR